MIYRLEYTTEALKSLAKIKKSAPSLYKKVLSLLEEIEQHPRIGTGHVECLKGVGGDVYSRRFSPHDRMIYKVMDDVIVVVVLQIGGHYNDK